MTRLYNLFRHLSQKQAKRCMNVLLPSSNLLNIYRMKKDWLVSRYGEKLPTGLILTGPNIAAHSVLFQQIETRIQSVDKRGRVAILTSKDSSNLKNVLKKIIRCITEIHDGFDDEDDIVQAKPGRNVCLFPLHFKYILLELEKRLTIRRSHLDIIMTLRSFMIGVRPIRMPK